MAAGTGDISNNIQAANPKPIRKNCKLHAVLAHLARGNSMNRFQAEKICHDHCLNSTISDIEKRGITVNRKTEVVPGYQNSRVHCTRYWLESEEITKAAKLLGWQNHDGYKS